MNNGIVLSPTWVLKINYLDIEQRYGTDGLSVVNRVVNELLSSNSPLSIKYNSGNFSIQGICLIGQEKVQELFDQIIANLYLSDSGSLRNEFIQKIKNDLNHEGLGDQLIQKWKDHLKNK